MPSPPSRFWHKPGAWVDLGLTLPIFVAYHLGVIFLHVRNASDLVTAELLRIAEGDQTTYLEITCGIGFSFAIIFWLLGRGQPFAPKKFVQIAFEGALYAVIMRVAASAAVGRIFAGKIEGGPFAGFVMALGAGFYEELAYRVLLFGLGAKIWVGLFAQESMDLEGGSLVPHFSVRAFFISTLWGIAASAIFSAVHYVGPLGDSFALHSFIFRALLGLSLTLIYLTRGFAAAVWTHTLYDVWVLVF